MTIPLLSALIGGCTTADFHLLQNSPVPSERLTYFDIDGRQCLSTLFRNVAGMVSSLHDFDGLPSMILKISSSVSVENPPDVVCHFGFGVYLCVSLKSFLCSVFY